MKWALLMVSGIVAAVLILPGSTFVITVKADSENVQTMQAEVSAYTSSVEETDDTPFITASGVKTRPGIVANNCLEFGTRVVIGGVEYEVQDRMNRRYGCEVFDIWKQSKHEARTWGRQSLTVIIKTHYEFE